MTETELRRAVIKAARRRELLVHHCTRSERCDGKGLPDLIIVGDAVIFAELKSEAGNATRSQADWIRALARTGAITRIWRPEHWSSGEIEWDLTWMAGMAGRYDPR